MLFEIGQPVPSQKPVGQGKPRFQAPNRYQIIFQETSLDESLPEDHPARAVWAYVAELDLGPLYGRIEAIAGGPGRPPIDPRILLALWLYATIDGVGSARALAKHCEDHLPYQWLCGGVSVNYHTLADFRTAHVEFLDELLTQSVAVLTHEGLVTLHRVAQDGMRVRASAGAASFHRRATLEEHLAEAEEQVRQLRAELEADPAAGSRREQAARQRAATERQERLQRALEQLPQIAAAKKPAARDQARVSSTDPDARVMKMADGGFRPAFNVQFATDTETQVITGVDVVNTGSDQGQMSPMVEQHFQRYGTVPAEYLVDGGFVTKEEIAKVSPPVTIDVTEPTVEVPAPGAEDLQSPTDASESRTEDPQPPVHDPSPGRAAGTTVYAPVPKPKKAGRDPHQPLPDDTPAVAAWRQRMGTPAAQQIFKDRAATAECVNAHARNRGLRQFLVRGLAKVKAVALWFAIAQNLLRTLALRAATAAKAV